MNGILTGGISLRRAALVNEKILKGDQKHQLDGDDDSGVSVPGALMATLLLLLAFFMGADLRHELGRTAAVPTWNAKQSMAQSS